MVAVNKPFFLKKKVLNGYFRMLSATTLKVALSWVFFMLVISILLHADPFSFL